MPYIYLNEPTKYFSNYISHEPLIYLHVSTKTMHQNWPQKADMKSKLLTVLIKMARKDKEEAPAPFKAKHKAKVWRPKRKWWKASMATKKTEDAQVTQVLAAQDTSSPKEAQISSKSALRANKLDQYAIIKLRLISHCATTPAPFFIYLLTDVFVYLIWREGEKEKEGKAEVEGEEKRETDNSHPPVHTLNACNSWS